MPDGYPTPLCQVEPLPPTASYPALLDLLRHPDNPRFQNWATTFACAPQATYLASTIDEVRLVVDHARSHGRKLRVRGSGHSPSDLVCVEDHQGVILDVSGLDAFLSVSPDNTEVHSEAGITLDALNSTLAALPTPLALASLGSISEQTLAGATQTATHGAGLAYGNLSSYITALDLVLPLPGAPLVRVSRQSDPDLFQSALCGLGACGVVVGVAIQVEPRFRLEEECWTMKWTDFQAHWYEIASSGEHVRAWWFPQVGEIKVSRMNRTSHAITQPPSALYSLVFDRLFAKHLHAVGLLVSKIMPSWWLKWHANVMWHLVHDTSSLWSTLQRKLGGGRGTSAVGLGWPGLKSVRLGRSGDVENEAKTSLPTFTSKHASPSWSKIGPSTFRVDWSENIFNYDCGFPQYTTELMVPLSEISAAMVDLTTWVGEATNQGLHFPIEMRWTKNDDIWLSPTYGDESGCYFGAIQYRPYNCDVPHRELFRAFEDVLKPRRARPHWAKRHSWTPTSLQALYPKLGDWLQVRARVDPEKVLVNDYLERHLFGGGKQPLAAI